MRKEYDFRGSRPNPYAAKLGAEGRQDLDRRFFEAEGFVHLDDEIAAAFPSAESVNEALRLVMQLREIGVHEVPRPKKTTPKSPRAKRSA